MPETVLALAQPNGTVTRMDGQRLAAAIHLPVDLRVAEGSFHSHGYAQADVAVTGAGVNIRLEVGWEHEVNAAVACPDRPACFHLRTRQDACVHAPIACLDVESIETPSDANVAIARIGFHLAIQIPGFDGAISGMHVHRPVDRFGLYGSVAGFHLQVSFARHAHFNLQPTRIVAKREAPMASNARRQFDLV